MLHNLHGIMQSIEQRWHELHVLVVGDVMLDKYIWGDVDRISPEAPVPVVCKAKQSERAGGAANVAMNIAGLGAKVSLVGVAGADQDGASLSAILGGAGVRAELLKSNAVPTTSKLRIFGGAQQMLRLDVEDRSGLEAEQHREILGRLRQLVPDADVVILSDYAKGVATEEVCQAIIEQARRAGTPVLVDPKARDFSRYRGATTICPNLRELRLATGDTVHELHGLLGLGCKMVRSLDLQYLTVTLSEKGIALLRSDRRVIAPAVAKQVYDVSGAGDTTIATFALGIASGLAPENAIELANVAAGVVVSKMGTVPVCRHELIAALGAEVALATNEKVLSLERLVKRVEDWRALDNKIVFTNGCYDLLHIGHVTLLEQARREGDKLIVAINSDRSVRELKGETRPVVAERQRAELLAALTVVDAVVIFNEPTPLRLVNALRPDVLVKGGDYTEGTVVGADEVKSWGGRVKLVPLVNGISTTQLISRANRSSTQPVRPVITSGIDARAESTSR